jgi:folate-binding protein YgfZ
MSEAVAYPLERDVVRIAGPEAISFLQGQLSQDVARLAIGDSAFTFLLEPQGKVSAWGRVTRTADDEIIFDVDGGFGDAAVARLNRFKLRTKADIQRLDWRVVAVRGDAPPPERAPGHADVVVATFDWPGFDGFDLLGVDVAAPAGVTVGAPADHERRRIEAGVPALGHELDADTIPAEAGPLVIERSVSFTKGCYTGQELVARVDSRGSNTPRRVRLVRIDGGVPGEGSEVVVDDKVAGRITSVAASATGAVALASVQRAVTPPVAAVVIDQAGRRYTSICVPLPESADQPPSSAPSEPSEP